MSESHATQLRDHDDWQMPISLEQYDRSPTLTKVEREALAEVIAHYVPHRPLLPHDRPSTQALVRLIQPLQDVYDFKQSLPNARPHYLYRMCQQMLKLNKPFWAWSKEEWIETIAVTRSTSSYRGVMITMRVTAYLLCGLLIIDDQYFPYHLARIVFGTARVTEQYERLASVIFGTSGLGYVRGRGQERHLRAPLVLAMLVNRNPSINAFTVECLRAARQLLVYQAYQDALRWMVRALVYLKILPETVLTNLFGSVAIPSVWWEYTESDVDPTWLAWVQAYSTQTNRGAERYRKEEFYQLLIAGRWLKQYHPAIVEPSLWDESLGYQYVTWVCHAKRGEFSHAPHQDASQAQLALQAGTIIGRIGAMRHFLKALQRRPYQIHGQTSRRLALAFDPDEVFATPETIRRQIVPNPRTLDIAWWQKLTWAAAALSPNDLATYGADAFPLAYYRAAALVWVTGARRCLLPTFF